MEQTSTKIFTQKNAGKTKLLLINDCLCFTILRTKFYKVPIRVSYRQQ